jgi:prepilin-type N-terminal cleavage/methylation domain-containing protein
VTHRRLMSKGRAPRRTRGFTLIEVLVAFSIISVATWILFSLFFHSLRIDKDSRSLKVAAELAREQLVDVQTNPGNYIWPKAAKLASGEAVVVTPREGGNNQGALTATAPTALPAVQVAGEKEQTFYGGFKVITYAKGPAEGGCVEITVVVRWVNAGKTKDVALTASVPRGMVEESA